MKTSKHNINKFQRTFTEKKQELINNHLKALHFLVNPEIIYNICKDEVYLFRKRIITPCITVFHMLLAAFSPETSFQSAWHFAGESCQSASLSKARKRLPLIIWEKLHKYVIQKTQEEIEVYERWRGLRIIGIDGTCVSMEDAPDLEKAFGRSGSKHGQSKFPIARIVFAFLLNGLICIHHEIAPYNSAGQIGSSL